MTNGEKIPGGVSLELTERAIPKERRLIKNPDAVREHNLEDLIKTAGGEEQLASIMREHVREGEEKPYYSVIRAVGSMMVAPEISDLFERVMESEAKKWLKEEYGIEADELAPEKLERMIGGRIPLLTTTGKEKKPEGTLVDRSRGIVEYLIKTGRDGSFESDPEGVYEAITGGEKIPVEEVKGKEAKEPELEPEEPEEIDVKTEVKAPVKEPEPEEEEEQPQEEEPQEPESEEKGKKEEEEEVGKTGKKVSEMSLEDLFDEAAKMEAETESDKVQPEEISEAEPVDEEKREESAVGALTADEEAVEPEKVEVAAEVKFDTTEPVLPQLEKAIKDKGKFEQVLSVQQFIEVAGSLLRNLLPKEVRAGEKGFWMKADRDLGEISSDVRWKRLRFKKVTLNFSSDSQGKVKFTGYTGINQVKKKALGVLVPGNFDDYVEEQLKDPNVKIMEFLNDNLELGSKRVKSVKIKFRPDEVEFEVEAG